MANIRWGARMDGTCKYKTIHFISESFVCVNRCITNCQSVCFCSIPNLGFSVLIWGNRRATTNQVTTTTDTSCTVYNHITATNNHIFCNVQSTAQHSWSPPSETHPPPFFSTTVWEADQPYTIEGRVRLTLQHSGERFPSPTTGEESMQCNRQMTNHEKRRIRNGTRSHRLILGILHPVSKVHVNR